MAPVINDVLRIVAAASRVVTPDVYSNTLHFKVAASGWASDLVFMTEMAIFLDATYTLVNGEIASGITYQNIDGQNLTQSVLMPLVLWPVLTIGGNVSEMLPTQTTARPYFPTLRPKTRAALGLFPFGESSQSGGGLLDATAIAAAEAFSDALLGNIVLPGGTLNYGAFNPAAVRFTPVDSRIVPDRFRTLRRRRVGVGS